MIPNLTSFADELTKTAGPEVLWRVWARHPRFPTATSMLVGAASKDAARDLVGRDIVTRVSRHLVKRAFLAKVVRLLETPIKGTPKLLMKVRDKAELAAREVARREKYRDAIGGNIYKALKKLRVDRAYQKLEPMIGSTTAPAAERALFGDRHIHAMAHRPIHWLLGNAPIPYASTAHNALVAGAQKVLNVPAARAYKMPEAISAAAKRMTGKEKALLAAKLTGAGAVGAGATAVTMHHGDSQ